MKEERLEELKEKGRRRKRDRKNTCRREGEGREIRRTDFQLPVKKKKIQKLKSDCKK